MYNVLNVLRLGMINSYINNNVIYYMNYELNSFNNVFQNESLLVKQIPTQ